MKLHPNTVRALGQLNARQMLRCPKCNKDLFITIGSMNSHKRWCGDDPEMSDRDWDRWWIP